ncbi:MAG: UDP-N-acetylglucosamine 2-epimerase (hydrolyzing) [Burkholderiales bacterium]|nr:UDP-N-acetylglucosamine 2-epimerase (hydrolyzing) [Phycisphaerae bacterium]
MHARRICYVTGTRAEFGLMRSTLHAIAADRRLEQQLVVTGMHLSRKHGYSLDRILADGWAVDAIVPWRATKSGSLASAVGRATAAFAGVFEKLDPHIVLICGDRVEPFAAASAAHIGGYAVAHVHGGDRAMGQVDDSLRHAITKLSHIHFCATPQSGARVFQLGEQRRRIHVVGAPGLDDLCSLAWSNPSEKIDAVIALHPESVDEEREYARARMLLAAVRDAGAETIVIINPNNDPGWRGIARCWTESAKIKGTTFVGDLPRGRFAALMAAAGVLVGNSSAGIIEAAALRLGVVNVGSRQAGRERDANVVDVPWRKAAITAAITSILRQRRTKRYSGRSVYGRGDAGKRIAAVLADVAINDQLRRKLIRY